MQDPDGHAWLFHRSGSHGPELTPITDARHPDVAYDAAGDHTVTNMLCAALADPGDIEFFTLWICEPDHSQHALELGSPEHCAVLAGADARVAQVAEAVKQLRAQGDDVLFILGSDHGHETLTEVVPVTEALIEAGLKDGVDSSDVVLASSGMGALLYVADSHRERRAAIGTWLAEQTWCEQLFADEDLARVGLPHDTELAFAFSMHKQAGTNRFGIPGLGSAAGDPFSNADKVGCGQHGGLGQFEANPTLIIDGDLYPAGVDKGQTRTIDIAPTIAQHLNLPVKVGSDGMDGSVIAVSKTD